MRNKTCCIFNLAPHYRAPIYTLMDQELNCDFYFGDSLGNQIKQMDYSSLRGFKRIIKNKRLTKTGFMWQSGVWHLIFKPYKYYIITGSPALLSNWVLAIWAVLLRKKVYAWTHGLKKPARSKGELFQKIFYKLCHKVLLYGDFSRNIMISEGFKPSKLVSIYNSLDHQNHLKIRRSLKMTPIFSAHFKNDNPVIIYIGRIQKSKKLDFLVLALKELLKKGFDCNLVLVGADVENDEIANLIKEKALGKNTWLYGACYDEATIGNLLFNANVCVSPGPVGLTALHALTFGCPVISNDDLTNQMPEHEAILPGKTGDFFKNNDMGSLVQTIKKWIYLDKEKRSEVRFQAHKAIDLKWNPNYQIKILKNHLNFES